jgi:hypothetical protein
VNEAETAEAIAAWLEDTLPALKKVWPFETSAKTVLPDGMVEIQEKSIGLGEEFAQRFPWAQLQQRMLKVFEVQITCMVDANGAPEDPKAAEETDAELKGYGAALETALLSQPTLGDRVQMASPLCSASYRLPFAQYPDGIRGRQMEFTMWVAELVDYEE